MIDDLLPYGFVLTLRNYEKICDIANFLFVFLSCPLLLMSLRDICFCFSLDLFKIYNFNNQYGYSINCSYYYGPYFSGGDYTFFYIYNSNGLLFGSNCYIKKGNSFGNVDNDYEINNGQSNFSVVELEVFQILFDN